MQHEEQVIAQPISRDVTNTNRFLLIAFPLGHLANDWPGAALWILAPAIALSMGLGPLEVGLLITIHSAGAALAYLPAGIIGDVFKHRGNLLTITFWWVAIGYFIAASALNFWLLAILLGLAGLADAAWHPIATGVMVEQMPKQRARVLGLHALGGTLAEVGAPVCVGFLLAYFEWQTILQLSTIPALLMGIAFLRFRHQVPQSSSSSLTRQDINELCNIWTQPRNLRVVGIIVFYNMALMGAMAMMPLYLQTLHQVSLSTSGILFAAIWGVGAIAQPILGHLSDYNGRKITTLCGLLFAATLLFMTILNPGLVGLMVLIILSLAAMVGIRAVLLAAMLDVAGKRETTTLGLAFSVMDGIGAFGAFLAGMVAQFDLHYAFIFPALSAMAAGILSMTHRFADHMTPTRTVV